MHYNWSLLPRSEQANKKAELQDQLAVAECRIIELEEELSSTKAEADLLQRAKELDQEKWGERLRAVEEATELTISREKERLDSPWRRLTLER